MRELDRQESELREQIMVKNPIRDQVKVELAAKQAELDQIEAEIMDLRERLATVWKQQNELMEGAKPEIVNTEESDPLRTDPPVEPEAASMTPEQKEVTVEVQVGQDHLEKLAYAVSMAETSGCTKGYGVEYSNCFGIKNGSIAPCEKIGRNNMCIYEHTDQSFDAFKKIWEIGYGGGFPTRKMAAVWTGNDHPDHWLNNVRHFYSSENL